MPTFILGSIKLVIFFHAAKTYKDVTISIAIKHVFSVLLSLITLTTPFMGNNEALQLMWCF